MPRKSTKTYFFRAGGLLTRMDVPRRGSTPAKQRGTNFVTVSLRPRTLGYRYSRTPYGALLDRLPKRGINIRRK